MRRKKLFIPVILSLSMVGCSNNKAEDVMNSVETIEPTEIASIIATEAETVIDEKMKETEIAVEDSYTECGDLYLLDNSFNAGIQVDMTEWDLVNKEYTLNESINIYYTDTSLAGYTKDNATVSTALSNGEWYFCVFDRSGYLVRAEDLESSVINDTVSDDKNAEVVPNEPVPVKEVTPVETTVQPVEEPVAEEPVIEAPVVEDSTKYTPEEAIAVYRSIMEANGIKWDPDLKNGGSWGTGFLYLDKGYAELAGNSNVESFKIGNHGGNSWKSYYLEVTGSDENTVYLTEWHP